MGGNGGPTCLLWWGTFNKEGNFAKKLAKKVASKVK